MNIPRRRQAFVQKIQLVNATALSRPSEAVIVDPVKRCNRTGRCIAAGASTAMYKKNSISSSAVPVLESDADAQLHNHTNTK